MPSRPRTDEFSAQAALFGDKVRAARKARRWSQQQLALESGVSFRQVQNIEQNINNTAASSRSTVQTANPKLDTIYLLATALELDIGYLVDPDRAVEAPA